MTFGQSGQRTVLLVDDDAMLRSILAQALVGEGFAVVTAEDGEQAWALASSLDGRLDLVVTDIRLPVMDGLELAACLARLKHPPPTLFISGFARKVPGPLLSKPFGPTAFLEQVARMLTEVQPPS